MVSFLWCQVGCSRADRACFLQRSMNWSHKLSFSLVAALGIRKQTRPYRYVLALCWPFYYCKYPISRLYVPFLAQSSKLVHTVHFGAVCKIWTLRTYWHPQLFLSWPPRSVEEKNFCIHADGKRRVLCLLVRSILCSHLPRRWQLLL